MKMMHAGNKKKRRKENNSSFLFTFWVGRKVKRTGVPSPLAAFREWGSPPGSSSSRSSELSRLVTSAMWGPFRMRCRRNSTPVWLLSFLSFLFFLFYFVHTGQEIDD